MKNLVLGIDVGGTNIKFGVIDRAGAILARSHLKTQRYTRDSKKLIAAVFAAIEELLAEHSLSPRQFAGIGMGLPGAVNPQRGEVLSLPNIPGWKNVPLRKIFEQRFKIPAILENDVNMITLGEWKFGAGIGYQNLVCVTLGTGVGGGLIFNGSLYRGEGFVAGEIGHMPLNEDGPACNCGGRGCFERYVGNQTLLATIARIFHRDLTIEDVYALAGRGDPKALRFWEETAVHIGNGLTGVVNLLNPPLIIIGGGVSNNHRFLFPMIKKVIKTRAMKVQARMVKIVRAQLDNDAAILGARVLVNSSVKNS